MHTYLGVRNATRRATCSGSGCDAVLYMWCVQCNDGDGDDCGSEDSCDLTGLVAAPKTAKTQTCCGAQMNANKNTHVPARDQRPPRPCAQGFTDTVERHRRRRRRHRRRRPTWQPPCPLADWPCTRRHHRHHHRRGRRRHAYIGLGINIAVSYGSGYTLYLIPVKKSPRDTADTVLYCTHLRAAMKTCTKMANVYVRARV